MINKIWKTFFNKKFIKFVIIGLINTFNHNLVYLSLLPYINYLLANFIAFIISMLISFFLSCYITFGIKPTWKKLIVFPVTNIPNLFFQTIGIYIIVDLLNIPKQYGAIITAIFSIPLTYLIMKIILDKKNN
ncbi:MAG: GtrA family protein [Ignavibacteriales bacterium]